MSEYESDAAREVKHFLDRNDRLFAQLEEDGYDNTFDWLVDYIKIYADHRPDGYSFNDSRDAGGSE